MTTYAVDDGEGNQLTAGLRGADYARNVAQRMANERGESVYLYESGEDEATAEPVEIAPERAPKAEPSVCINADAVLTLLWDIKQVWDREGFGSDDAVSEPLKTRLESAIAQMRAIMPGNVDSLLYEYRPKFGCAGGADVPS